ncbi:MAG: S24 family peptidase [Dehalococcoidia bacterium]
MELREAIGERVRVARSVAKLSQEDLARLIGVSRVTILSIEKGQHDAKAWQLDRIAGVLQQPLDYFLGQVPLRIAGTGNHRALVVSMPVLNQDAAAGAGLNMQDFIQVPQPEPTSHKYFALKISSNCLAPQIYPDDVVIVDCDLAPVHGNIVVARMDGLLVVKRFIYRGGQLYLESNDKAFPCKGCTIEGVVVLICRKP